MSKKKLTVEQVFKKETLLQKTQEKIKGKTQKQISKIWQDYRGKKYVIEYLPDYKKKIAKATPEKKEKLRVQYFDRKEFKTAKLEFGTLKLEKKIYGTGSYQKFYKLKAGADLDGTIDRIFEKSNPRYILVTLKIRLSTGSIMFVSDTLTADAFYNLQEMEISAMEKILEKLAFVTKYDGFDLISIHIRTIYANTKKAK